MGLMAEGAETGELDGAELAGHPLGSVDWFTIEWAVSDRLTSSLHLELAATSGVPGTRLLETYPISPLANGTAGIFAVPGAANLAEGSPKVSVAGVDDNGGDLEVEVQ